MNLNRIFQKTCVLASLVLNSLIICSNPSTAQEQDCVITDKGITVCGKLITQTRNPNPNTEQQCTKNNTVYLKRNYRSSQFSGVLTAPGNGNQRYKITCINVTDFTQGGKLAFKIRLSNGISAGSFDLFPKNFPIPSQGNPNGTLVGRYDISPNSSTEINHFFEYGTVFQFGASGNWGSPVNSTNFYQVNVTVEGF